MHTTDFSPKSDGRIAFIDLMKGIVVLLILLRHLRLDIPSETMRAMLSNMRIPTFFFLSGLFISLKYNTRTFFIKKVNNLIVPYMFFGVLALVLVLLFPKIPPLKYEADFILEMNAQSLYHFFAYPANIPTWFLFALMYASIIFFILAKVLHRVHPFVLIIVTITIGYFGRQLSYYMATYPDSNPLVTFLRDTHFSIGMEATFYLMAGYLVRRSPLFAYNPGIKARLAIIACAGIIWWFSSRGITAFNAYYFGNQIHTSYIAGLSSIFVVWFIAQGLNYLPYVSYIGRYSIIVLGSHTLYQNIIENYFPTNPYIELAVILVLLPLTIYVLTRYLPWLTAQRPLIPVPGERRRDSSTSAPAFEGAIAAEGQELGAENLRKL
ncbi:MAG: acyltransferase [Muribaculaceae bacterium]